MAASLWSPVDPKCINPGAVPQLTKLVEAAIYQPLASAGGEFVSDVLKATGNEALVQAALATALTPEQAARLKTMSNDPEVAKTLAEIQDKLSVAVAQSIETAKQTVAPQLEKVSGDVVNGVVVSIMNAISDIPGVGFLLSLLGMVDTGIKALGQARTIQNSLINAAAPVAAVLGEVDKVTGAVSAAAAPGQEIEMQSMDVNESHVSANPPQFVEAKPQKPVDPNHPFAIKQTEKEEQQDNAGLGGGGSRKRRRIHKLSRRIERTLRRVQKKYGFKNKGDFLRRTLKHHKHKR